VPLLFCLHGFQAADFRGLLPARPSPCS
jgi:hypothetical protein